MELVVDNPFRVLGLPATATSREISKRVSDLETFAEFGKLKKFETDLTIFGGLVRTVLTVKAAAQKIEQAEHKLFHSFFWFRNGHEFDAKALAALADGDHGQALATWNEELSKSGKKRYSSRLNRAVLKLWLATRGPVFDHLKFAEALEDIGFVVDDHLDESVNEVLGVGAVGLNKDALWKRVVDTLVDTAQSVPGNPYGTNAMALVSACWSFPHSTLDHIKATVTNPVLERVEAAIAASKARRKVADQSSDFEDLRQLKDAESLLKELQLVLGDEHPRFQTVANDFADELSDCSVMANNEFDDLDLAMKLIDWSARIPTFGQVKIRIAKNKATTERNVDRAKVKKYTEPVVKALVSTPNTISEAETKLRRLKFMLAELQTNLGAQHPDYIDMSSESAHHILGYAIRVANAVQTDASKANLNQIATVLEQCIALARELLPMDLDPECRARVMKTLGTMHEVERQAQDAIAKSQPKFWESIPGWLWIVGVIVLIAIFK